jgi:hypothetical protein
MLVKKVLFVSFLVLVVLLVGATGVLAGGGGYPASTPTHVHTPTPTPEMIVICHNGHTLTIDKHDEEDDDYEHHTHGACPTSTPEPKVTICVDGVTLEIDKCDEDEDRYEHHTDGACPTTTPQVTPALTPTIIPEITPEVTPEPSCELINTGKVLYQLYMNDTNPLHYGYYTFDGTKTGVCQIVTDGGYPNDFSNRACNCQMPDEFRWLTTGYDMFYVWKTCDGSVFYKTAEGETVVPFGRFVFGQYCNISQCLSRY